MVGLLLGVCIGVGMAGLWLPLLRRHFPSLDGAELLGLSGIAGLLLLGWLCFFAVPPRLAWLPAFLAVPGWWLLVRTWKRVSFIGRPWAIPLGIALLIGVISALAPATMSEWDTLAYHFAVPKLWLAAGAKIPIPFIHHSNFPFVVDSLFLLGLSLKMESLARTFSLLLPCFGALTVVGLLRRRGEVTGPRVLLLLAGMPVLLSQLGTGYVDLSHGFLFGLGAAYGCELLEGRLDAKAWVLAGLLIGGAMASKYTGIMAGVALVALLPFAARPFAWRWIAAGMLCAIMLPLGWYIRNTVNTGNPVYPFLYSKLGGRGWDQWRADIYENEQKSFGVGVRPGKSDWTQVGHAVLGLGYQPGRYINPNPQAGTGMPNGAVGAAWVVALATLLVNGRAKLGRRGSLAVGFVVIQLGAWFLLSQQARYLSGTYIFVAIMVAPLLQMRLFQVLVAAQFAYAVALQGLMVTEGQLPALGGMVAFTAVREQGTPFARVAPSVSSTVGKGRVALYDEVFGYLLDCDYVWGNPGHSMLFANDTAEHYYESSKAQKVTHIYWNLRFETPEVRDQIGQAIATHQFDPKLLAQWEADPQVRWKAFLITGLKQGTLSLADQFKGPSLLFELYP